MDCVICNEKDTSKSFVANPSLDSFEKILSRSRERAEYKDSTVLNFVERTKGVTAVELLENRCRYHESCYASFANIGKLQRVKKRYATSLDTGEPSAIKRKSGRPSLTSLEGKDSETVRTRSKSTLYDKTLCIICQKPGGKVHEVQTKDVGRKMLSVSEKLDDKLFYMRLNAIPSADDAIANDVVYHNICWVVAQRKAKPKNPPAENYIKTLSDIELINFIEVDLTENSENLLDMNKLNSIYKVILLENGEQTEHLASNYKKHIKELVEENIPNVVFVKSAQKNQARKADDHFDSRRSCSALSRHSCG